MMTRMLIRFFRQPAIDPLQVSMTGVRMGEKFVLVGCDDPVLLAGLGAKVGMSGSAAAVAFDEHQAVRARGAAAREGVLLELKIVREGEVPFDEASFDMAVIDDTRGGFANRPGNLRATVLAKPAARAARRRADRSGGGAGFHRDLRQGDGACRPATTPPRSSKRPGSARSGCSPRSRASASSKACGSDRGGAGKPPVQRRQVRCRPPSTAMVSPVIQPALSEATKSTASAISPGVPGRPSGCVSLARSRKAA